jgi:protein-L-isoaspartate O-methyltransferase
VLESARRAAWKRAKAAWVVGSLAGAAFLAALWWRKKRKNPSACPYGQRFFLEMPRPFVTLSGLREMLRPEPGERVLEVGPGTGYYSLYVARCLEPDGTLDVFDLQRGMLEHTLRRAQERGISNVVPTQGDAQTLPYPDGSFDAAYLVATLGEIPDQEQALRGLRRVLKPGGRLVVGEAFPDPHRVAFGTLLARAEKEGLRFERRLGGALGYYARFTA